MKGEGELHFCFVFVFKGEEKVCFLALFWDEVQRNAMWFIVVQSRSRSSWHFCISY